MAERKWNIPVNAFPQNENVQPEAQQLNAEYNKPDAYLEPIVRVISDDGYKGDESALNDSIPSIQFKHKKADGTMNEDHQQIGVENLSVFINTTGADKNGRCFDEACNGLLWPREIEIAFADPRLAVSQGDKDRVAAYKVRFNHLHAAGFIGGARRTIRRRKAAKERRKQTRRRATNAHR